MRFFYFTVASTTARPGSRPVKPKHKPVTYVEQLKKLNEGHHKPRGKYFKSPVQVNYKVSNQLSFVNI